MIVKLECVIPDGFPGTDREKVEAHVLEMVGQFGDARLTCFYRLFETTLGDDLARAAAAKLEKAHSLGVGFAVGLEVIRAELQTLPPVGLFLLWDIARLLSNDEYWGKVRAAEDEG